MYLYILSAVAVTLAYSAAVSSDNEGVPLAAAFSNNLVPKLFQALSPGRENLVFAPFGLAASLAMALEVVDQETAEEVRRVLRVRPQDISLLRTGFTNILLECEKALQEEEAAGTYNKVTMHTAQNLSQQHYSILTDSYRANPSFSQALSNNTEQVLSLQSDSGVMSHWKDFHKLAVYTYLSHEAAAPFTTATGAVVHVPLVPQVGLFRVGRLHRLNCQAVQLPLQSRRVHLILLLPDDLEGTDELLVSLPKEKLLQMVKSLPIKETEVSLPQLAILTNDLDLAPFLRQLGVGRLFTDSKNYVHSIKQNAYFSTSFVAVNSVASIATQLGVRTSNRYKREASKIVVDRPFLFFLVHSPSDVVLLAGIVRNPTQVPFPTERSVN